jgi:hypothetical protein
MGVWSQPLCVRCVSLDRRAVDAKTVYVTFPNQPPEGKHMPEVQAVLVGHGVEAVGQVCLESVLMGMCDCAKIWGYLEYGEFVAWEWFFRHVMAQNQHLRSVEFHLYCTDFSVPYCIRASRHATNPLEARVTWTRVAAGSQFCFKAEPLTEEDESLVDKKGRPRLTLTFSSEEYIRHVTSYDTRPLYKLYREDVDEHIKYHCRNVASAYSVSYSS